MGATWAGRRRGLPGTSTCTCCPAGRRHEPHDVGGRDPGPARDAAAVLEEATDAWPGSAPPAEPAPGAAPGTGEGGRDAPETPPAERRRHDVAVPSSDASRSRTRGADCAGTGRRRARRSCGCCAGPGRRRASSSASAWWRRVWVLSVEGLGARRASARVFPTLDWWWVGPGGGRDPRTISFAAMQSELLEAGHLPPPGCSLSSYVRRRRPSPIRCPSVTQSRRSTGSAGSDASAPRSAGRLGAGRARWSPPWRAFR